MLVLGIRETVRGAPVRWSKWSSQTAGGCSTENCLLSDAPWENRESTSLAIGRSLQCKNGPQIIFIIYLLFYLFFFWTGLLEKVSKNLQSLPTYFVCNCGLYNSSTCWTILIIKAPNSLSHWTHTSSHLLAAYLGLLELVALVLGVLLL